jgi:hypothetical protein
MRFVGRAEEVEILRKFRDLSAKEAQFMVVTGRRRVGKTSLLRHALDDGQVPYVHLPITRQSEKTLCMELQEEVERVLDLGILGVCERFSDLFKILMTASKKIRFSVVLDEFQEFDRINPAVFSQIAAVWDEHHSSSRINLVVCGSINRLMNKVFFNDGEPLYGRNTGSYQLRPFKVSLLKQILSEGNPKYSPDDLLALWTVTGGVARYVNMMMNAGAVTREAMVNVIFSPGSSYLAEGRAILAEEFGPDYGTYFTILSAIASGATTTAEIKNLLGVDVNGYMTKLEEQYQLVSKKQPIFGKPTGKNCHYQIDDCFFRYWFRFVFKYRGYLELERYDQLRQMAMRDFDVFSEYALERYFHWKFAETTSFVHMGAWWDRKGSEEIDLVCEDELGGEIAFYEVKRDPTRFDSGKLAAKVEAFFAKHPEKRELKKTLGLLSLNDM